LRTICAQNYNAGMDEFTPQERAALITARLFVGQKLTGNEIMRITGLASRSAVHHMMRNISRSLPIYLDTKSHTWQWLPED